MDGKHKNAFQINMEECAKYSTGLEHHRGEILFDIHNYSSSNCVWSVLGFLKLNISHIFGVIVFRVCKRFPL